MRSVVYSMHLCRYVFMYVVVPGIIAVLLYIVSLLLLLYVAAVLYVLLHSSSD